MKKPSRVSRKASIRRKVITLAVASCFATELAHANPTGASVVSGQVSITTNGNLVQVTNSPGSIINWQGFSIGANEITRFIQQSASSTVLNRVVGVNPSVILGTLQSNGRVMLINSNGIVFGAGATIDTAGRAECGDECMFPSNVAGTLKEFHILRIRSGPSAFDIVHTEFVQFSSNSLFVIKAEADAFAL